VCTCVSIQVCNCVCVCVCVCVFVSECDVCVVNCPTNDGMTCVNVCKFMCVSKK